MNNKIIEIEPMIYDTLAMQNPIWKQINCKDRHYVQRKRWTNKSFQNSAKEDCECEKCGELIKQIKGEIKTN